MGGMGGVCAPSGKERRGVVAEQGPPPKAVVRRGETMYQPRGHRRKALVTMWPAPWLTAPGDPFDSTGGGSPPFPITLIANGV